MSELQEMNNKIHANMQAKNEALLAEKKALQIENREQKAQIKQLQQENEQVKGAYEDRVDDIKSLEEIIHGIRAAYESDDENGLDEFLHDLFTNQLVEDY